MIHLVTEIVRLLLIVMIAIYTYDSFKALRSNTSPEEANLLYFKQTILLYMTIFCSSLVLYLHTNDQRVIIITAAESVLFALAMLIYKNVYQYANKPLVNNMCMLLAISIMILTRLRIEHAIRQLFMTAAALLVTCIIPLMIEKLRLWKKLTFLYAAVGIVALAAVAVLGRETYGAKINIKVGPVLLQPSEFVKILLVFFIASMLYARTDFRQVVITGIITALMVLILVASKDLGSAFIFFITYLVMVYVSTQRPVYLLAGVGMMVLAAVAGYFMFAHVRVRVLAWQDPLSVVNDQGYQICQSLFAIGTGGWFGSGLYQGMPEKIPVVTTDFVFSAISEELGALFALSMIFICISNFLMFFNIAMQIRDQFYKLIALGLGTVYGIQVFTTLGGVTKFIPSTGVTLPLVSYGGSSILSTMMLFAIIQGLYKRAFSEGDLHEKKQKKRKRA
ncbi:cell division protein FtsW, lipid II flippase [Lachnospiraceae bacterium C10]|nr:cell division protein FtsW, lipid II flippase [Lachnospiraceae bacterium C10]